MKDLVKISDQIALFLKQKEIKLVFGIVGAANSHIFDSITNLGYTEIICVHHEQAATMAMQAYYRITGKITAALVTAGGGSSNAITGVLSAWADSIPGIIISGQENTKYIESMFPMRMWGIQGYDSTEMVRKITKYATRIMKPENAIYELEKAYHISGEGRPGPTWVDYPMDMQGAQIKENDLLHYSPVYKAPPTVSADTLEQVFSCISQSKRPVFWLGYGIRIADAVNLLEPLLEKFPFPVILTWAAADMLDNAHKLNFGRAGVYGNRSANFIVQNADLIISIGNRLAIPVIGYAHDELARDATIIQVDIDEEELEKTKDIADISILSDAKEFLRNLITGAIHCNLPNISEWYQLCCHYQSSYPNIGPEHDDKNGYINSYRFIDKLSDHFIDDQVVTTDMGTALLSGHQVVKLKEGQRFMTSTGLGEMGYGLPAAIGASFAKGKGNVMCLNCDGGMMMNLQELQTIVHHNLPIKIIIFNNDGYLMIKHTQKNLFKGRYSASNKASGVTCPDYQKIATAFGIKYFSINSWDDFDNVVPHIQTLNEPVICDVFMDPEQYFHPKLSIAIKEDGSIISPPLEDLSPLLPRNVLEKEMLVGIHEKSKGLKC